MSITQFEYYRLQGLHPSCLLVEDDQIFVKLYFIRKHLSENPLHIPLKLLDGKNVHEVKCRTGESSLVLALHSTRMSLIDADKTVGSRLNTLF